MKNPFSYRARGFTLVELLVVIAIVSVLATVVFSFTQKGLRKARQVTSVGNMRQIAILMSGYAAENGGRLPALREQNNGQEGSVLDASKPGFWHWHQALVFSTVPEATVSQVASDLNWWKQVQPIVVNPQFIKSPSFSLSRPGYAMNFSISANVTGSSDWFKNSRYRTHLSSIPDPARTPLLVPHWDWHSSGFLSGRRLNSDVRANRFLIDGKLNVTFVDGHSELIQFTDAAKNNQRIANSEYVRRELHLMPKL